jgi:hypothetical protein
MEGTGDRLLRIATFGLLDIAVGYERTFSISKSKTIGTGCSAGVEPPQHEKTHSGITSVSIGLFPVS